jgi:hypothetical protein
MSPNQSQTFGPSLPDRRSPRRLALPLGLLAALSALGFTGTPTTGGGDDGGRRRAAGDGRGLVSFGDRGLTSFGGRFSEGFGQRGLTSFSDTPLASMGGLIQGGVPASDSTANEGHSHSHHPCSSGTTSSFSDVSQVSLHLDAVAGFDDFSDDSDLLMPAVELPKVVFDHRPAAALLDATLDAAIRAATESGDLDLARSLDPDRR